jgi:high-affinity Fe2+/Pb2+ permease
VTLVSGTNLYLAARVAGTAFVLGMYVVWLRPALGADLRTLYYAGLVFFVLAMLVALAVRAFAKRPSMQRTLLLTLPFDLVGLALLTAAA